MYCMVLLCQWLVVCCMQLVMLQDAELKPCPLLCTHPPPPGYRYVHILSPSGEKLEQCTIFVHVKIENAADVVYEASAD